MQSHFDLNSSISNSVILINLSTSDVLLVHSLRRWNMKYKATTFRHNEELKTTIEQLINYRVA